MDTFTALVRAELGSGAEPTEFDVRGVGLVAHPEARGNYVVSIEVYAKRASGGWIDTTVWGLIHKDTCHNTLTDPPEGVWGGYRLGSSAPKMPITPTPTPETRYSPYIPADYCPGGIFEETRDLHETHVMVSKWKITGCNFYEKHLMVEIDEYSIEPYEKGVSIPEYTGWTACERIQDGYRTLEISCYGILTYRDFHYIYEGIGSQEFQELFRTFTGRYIIYPPSPNIKEEDRIADIIDGMWGQVPLVLRLAEARGVSCELAPHIELILKGEA